MAVTEVKTLSAGVSGGAEGTDSGTVRLNYSSTHQVKCDNPEDGPGRVLHYFRTHTSLPWPGRTFRLGNEFDTGAICRSVRPVRVDDSGGIYNVSCDFDDRETDEQEQKQDENGKITDNPIDWLPEIEVSSGGYSMPVEHATFLQALNADGASPHMKPGKFLPVTNSALQPLNPTFEEEYSYKIIRFARNVAAYDDAFWNKYHDAINKSEVTINLRKLKFKTVVAKHHGKLKVGASLNFTNGVLYYRRTLELQIRAWDRPILDQGTLESYSVGDSLPDQSQVTQNDIPSGRTTMDLTAKDRDDMPLADPFLLDGKGKRLKEGKPPVSLVWRTFHEEDFSKVDWP